MSDDRLFTTSYRYEVLRSNAQFLRKSLSLQHSRIEKYWKLVLSFESGDKLLWCDEHPDDTFSAVLLMIDEKIASRIEAENKVASELERARWFTSLEEDSEKRREKMNSEMMDSEIKMANEEFIKIDEKIASRIEAENKVASELERARWFTSLEEDSEKRREKMNSEMMDSEIKMANEEFIKVRRAQLQKLLLEEHLQYEKELNVTGKAFYKKRI